MNRPVKWRYAAFGAGFAGLAGLRLWQDEPVWAAVFAVAAAVNLWLAGHEGAREAAGAAPGGPVPERAEVERSLEGYRTDARRWHVLGAAGVLLGGGLLLVEPALAVLAGAAALFALYRARRAGRAVTTLRRAAPAQK